MREAELSNPRFVCISDDDTMWFYNHDTTLPGPSYPHVRKWLETYVFSKVGPSPCSECPDEMTCESVDQEYAIFPALYSEDPANRDDTIQFAGVCGTSLVIASGFRSRHQVEFSNFFRENVEAFTDQSDAWLGFVREKESQSLALFEGNTQFKSTIASLAGFWDGFEDELYKVLNGSSIDLILFEEENQAYFHFELGEKEAFRSEFIASLADRAGFINWLKNGTSTGATIPRNIYTVDENGCKTQIYDVEFKDLDMLYAQFRVAAVGTTPPCQPCQCFHVCSILAGTVLKNQIATGKRSLSIGLEVVATKDYCPPCPPPCP